MFHRDGSVTWITGALVLLAGCSSDALTPAKPDAAGVDAGDASRERASVDASRSRDAGASDGHVISTFNPIRIACGQTTSVMDVDGNVWSADKDYAGGTALTIPGAIAGTASPALYTGQRYGASSSAFHYAIPLPAGQYVVLLKFDEGYFTGDSGTGERVFDVSLNGDVVLQSFDIYAAAGNSINTAVDRSFPVTVGSSGTITLDFNPVVQDPKIDAIEISQGSTVDSGVTDTGAPHADAGLLAEKANLLSYFTSTAAAGHVLSGQHWWYNPGTSSVVQIDDIYSQTGKYPAILGVGFDWSGETDTVQLAVPWAAAGGIVFGGSWFNNPATGGSQSDLNITFSDLLATGTTVSNSWFATLDALATKMAALQSAGVVVMYRPFIELNGNWFWWGNQTPSEFIAVWQQVHDYLVNTKHLDNIIWVYNVNAGVGNYASYYPGDAYVDVVSFDYYGSNPASDITSTYTALQTIDKPMMVAEFGCITSDWMTIQAFTCDNNQLISQIHQSFPEVFALAVWSANWAIPDQNGESALMSESWFIDRATLPAGL